MMPLLPTWPRLLMARLGRSTTSPEPTGISALQMAEAISHQLSRAGAVIPTKSVSLEEGSQLFPPFMAWIFSINNMVDTSKAKRELHWDAAHKDVFAAEIASAVP